VNGNADMVLCVEARIIAEVPYISQESHAVPRTVIHKVAKFILTFKYINAGLFTSDVPYHNQAI
jgi:hypothetical protein